MPASLPQPRPLPEAPSLRWGVLAPGGIAGRFVDAVLARTGQRVVAIGSRSAERAAEFARAHGVERSYGSYDALVGDPEVDVVYIASPHSAHAEQALLAIAAGKHVLIEKPFTADAASARTVQQAAAAAGVLAMEAMWTRYLPQYDVLRQLLADGAVGEIGLVEADFGFSFPFDPAHRLYDPAQAGGALLDAGVYPLSFVSSVLGAPTAVTARGSLAPTGVDERATMLLDYADPAVRGIASTALTSMLPVQATISGTEGIIELIPPFLFPTGIRFSAHGPVAAEAPLEWVDRTFEERYDALSYEATALAGYVAEGRLESPLHPLDEVVSVIEVIDETRRQLGAR